MSDHREVTIRLDYDARVAQIWCARRTVERKLARLGYRKIGEQIGGTWWEAPLAAISFRKPRVGAVSGATRGNPLGINTATDT